LSKIQEHQPIEDRDMFLADINGVLIVNDATWHSAWFNNLESLKIMLTKWNCVPNDIINYSSCNNGDRYPFRMTTLGFAEKHRNLEMIRCLLKHPNFVNFDADGYITKALTESWPEDLIELLFDKGGRFKIEDFFKVIKNANFVTVKLLVDLGIDVNVKDENEAPAIITAISTRNLYIIGLLLSKKIDFDAQDKNGKKVSDYLLEYLDRLVYRGEYSQETKNKFKEFRKRISEQIYNDLEYIQLPRDHADLISEYLA
jgi:hypothetical protein